MKFLFRIFSIIFCLTLISASLSISKVVVRVPRENDIGLIFDVSVTNAKKNSQNELLEFNIRAANTCTIDLGGQRLMTEAGRIVGGSFGCIEAGSTETVSLIWPTISLYNRVGCCPIIITSTNLQSEQFYLQETLSFDTKFETLDPQGTGIRKSKNFRDCNNFDLDYLNKCKPVNCEERYFGIRNFFNECTQQCEPVPVCSGEMLYDPFANECIDAHSAVTKKDIHDIKHGFFKEYEEWKTEISHNAHNRMFHGHKNSKHDKRESVDVDDGDVDTNIDENENVHANQRVQMRSSWLKGTIDGLMLVFATIGIYVIICFVIFLVVSCISRRKGLRDSISFSAAPSVSEKGIPIRSRSSLLSRR